MCGASAIGTGTRTYCFALGALLLALHVASCAKADPYADVAAALTEMIEAKTRLATEVASAGTPEAMAEALTAFAERTSRIAPTWEEALKRHPEIKWDAPPPSVAPLMESYVSVMGEHDEAVARAEEFVERHPDHGGLQMAYEKFLISERYHER